MYPFAKWLFRCIHSYCLKNVLTLVMVNTSKLRCHTHFSFLANQITWSRFLIEIHIFNDKQCRSRSDGFFRSQLIWIYIVCKGRTYPGSAGLGLKLFESGFWSPYLKQEKNDTIGDFFFCFVFKSVDFG